MRSGQTHVESFRRVFGEGRHGLSARVDVVLVDGGGFSGSPSRYDAMLAGRRHRLAELDATVDSLSTAAALSPAAAEVYLRAQVDILAHEAEKAREPLNVTDLLTARRFAETRPDTFVEKVQELLVKARRNAEAFRLCDVR
jgi:hypothetical protein